MVESRVVALSLVIVGCGDAGEVSATGTGTSAAASGSSGTGTSEVTPTSDASGSSSGGGSSSSGGSSSGEPPVAAGWLRGFGAPEQQRPGGLGFDASGALWVAGDVFGAIDLGAGALTGPGSGLYLAKFAADGSTLHAQAMFPADGAVTLTLSSGLAVDSTGAVVVTGWLEGAYTIGGEPLVADELDVFVGKWDPSGAPLWGRRFGAADWQVGHAVAIGADDAIWIAGAALAGFTAGDVEVVGTGSTGIVVLRLAPDGTPELGRWLGDAGDQEAQALAVCDDGSIALAGFFTATLTWAPGLSATASGDKDMFVGTLGADGEPRWLVGYGGPGQDVASHVACGDAVVFAGSVTGPASFGALELAPVDQADTVLGRLALADGALLWAAGITGPEPQRPGGLALDGDGRVLVAISSQGAATLGDRVHAAVGAEDVVFASYAPPATTPELVTGLGGADTQRAGALAVHAEAVAIAATIAGETAWPGLPAVAAAGAQDLGLLSFTPAGR